jgi:hypothetical protein
MTSPDALDTALSSKGRESLHGPFSFKVSRCVLQAIPRLAVVRASLTFSRSLSVRVDRVTAMADRHR